jgi:hypothetical protein
MPEQKVSFSWRNYAKPTPRNMEALAASARRILAIIAGTTIIVEANHWVTFWIIFFGAVLDEAKNFFAMVGHEYDEKVTINVPPAMTDKVEITEDVNQPKE